MSDLARKLTQSLAVRKSLQEAGGAAIASASLSRTHRQRLQREGFLREVMKGWYIPCAPEHPVTEPSAWVASYWAFVADYLRQRFADAWCLGPEESLQLHVGDFSVPRQLVIRSAKGGNKPTPLLHGTALLDVRLKIPAARDIEVRGGLRLMALPAALMACAPGDFAARPIAMRAALALFTDAAGLVERLLAGGHSVVAGRLAGAFRQVGRGEIADRIVAALRAAGFKVHERDPFAGQFRPAPGGDRGPPEVHRLCLTRQRMRAPILRCFPPSPGPIVHATDYLQAMDRGYPVDAFHSLSLEGYRVSAQMIEETRGNGAQPGGGDRDALAAYAYWRGFQAVRKSVERVLAGDDVAIAVSEDLDGWYRALSVPLGWLEGAAPMGYRNGRGHLRFSFHVPPLPERLDALMRTLFELLQAESQPAIRVVFGHFALAHIHPYPAGNGLVGRFLMNVLRAGGGYPWLVIPVSRHLDYRAALEAAHREADIAPLAKFLGAGSARYSRWDLTSIP